MDCDAEGVALQEADRDCDDGDSSIGGESLWYRDSDHDGYGIESDFSLNCSAPTPEYISSSGDCNDNLANNGASVFPGASKSCNGIDDDCDAVIDEGVTTLYYLDSDGDGYGDSSEGKQACEPPTGYADEGGDCDDTDPAFHPDASEDFPNGMDMN